MTRQNQPRPDARALIARLNKEGKQLLQREIIAPLLPGGKIRTRLNKLVYEFKLRGSFVGWGRFRPLNEREAEPLGEALPWERSGYLELLPALRVLLLWPDPAPHRPAGTWLALPYNQSDAQTRFGLSMDPVSIFLCDPLNGAERFERVIARVDGKTLWFDGPDLRADPTHAEWLREAVTREDPVDQLLSGLADSERLALLYGQIRQIELAEAEERQHYQQLQADWQDRVRTQDWSRPDISRTRLETRLRHALTKADAVFLNVREVPTSSGDPTMIVEWRERNQQFRYRTTIDRHLNVVSSGICLSERDHEFDLTSLVNVISESPDWA